MSELLDVDRHNYGNPPCPYCGCVTAKNGKITRKHGLVQRYRCVKCGRTFQTIIKKVLGAV